MRRVRAWLAVPAQDAGGRTHHAWLAHRVVRAGRVRPAHAVPSANWKERVAARDGDGGEGDERTTVPASNSPLGGTGKSYRTGKRRTAGTLIPSRDP